MSKKAGNLNEALLGNRNEDIKRGFDQFAEMGEYEGDWEEFKQHAGEEEAGDSNQSLMVGISSDFESKDDPNMVAKKRALEKAKKAGGMLGDKLITFALPPGVPGPFSIIQNAAEMKSTKVILGQLEALKAARSDHDELEVLDYIIAKKQGKKTKNLVGTMGLGSVLLALKTAKSVYKKLKKTKGKNRGTVANYIHIGMRSGDKFSWTVCAILFQYDNDQLQEVCASDDGWELIADAMKS